MTFFSTPGVTRLVDDSPQPVGSAEMRHSDDHTGYLLDGPQTPGAPHAGVQSAPAELGAPRHKLTLRTPTVKLSLDHQIIRAAPTILAHENSADNFELDANAPLRAIRAGSSRGSGDVHEPSALSRGPSMLQAVAEEEEKGEEGVPPSGEREGRHESETEAWGESFKIEWLCTDKLPFHRTRHIRNPWNHDREVKVSRDGTEVEPIVGQRLLDEWERLAEIQSPVPGKAGSSSKRGSRSAPPVVPPVPLRAGTRGTDETGVEGAEAPPLSSLPPT
jgi:hypothetical protein